MGTDENLFRLVPIPGHGARVLLELVPMPGHGAQISAWAPRKKGYVQTGARVRATFSGTKSEQGVSLLIEFSS